MSYKKLYPLNFFIARRPYLPLDNLLKLNELLSKNDIEGIKAVLSEEQFIRTIFFSSRVFHKIALKWLNDASIKYDGRDKVLISLYKYYVRICTRCTPYGLFAGYAIGNITDNRSFLMYPQKDISIMLRTDMLFLSKKKNEILTRDNLLKVPFFPNNTLYKVNTKLRFVTHDNNYNYEISEVSNQKVLSEILRKAESGIKIERIFGHIQEEYPSLDDEDIFEYIYDLIESKVLVDNLPPFPTSRMSPTLELMEHLSNLGIDSSSLNDLVIDAGNIDSVFADIEELINKNQHLLAENDQICQVDVKFKSHKLNLNEDFLNKAIKWSLKLSKKMQPRMNPRLLAFKQNFIRRFDQKEVSLIYALDPELGVGYDLHLSGNIESTPLLENIYFSFNGEKKASSIPEIIKLIIDKYCNYLDINNGKSIILTDDDLSSISDNPNYNLTQHNYFLFGKLITGSPIREIPEDEMLYLQSSAPTAFAIDMLSRFAQQDEELYEVIQSRLNEQPTSDQIIMAEIVHIPNDKLGNIALRPNFFEYEIAFFSNTNPGKIPIPLEDIMVSIINGRITLRSKKLNKEIRVRHSSALNFGIQQLPFFRFMCDLQYQNIENGVFWDWSVLSDLEFLPKVCYKNIILTEARWKMKKKSSVTVVELKEKLLKLNIPRYCLLKEGDNVLTLDTENSFCINLILDKLNKTGITLYEDLADYEAIGDGYYNNEILVPLLNKEERSTHEYLFRQSNIDIKRTFPPGSEWLYLKIYCSHQTEDNVLISVVEKSIPVENEKWFFIRYEDPEPHIRLRMKHVDLNQFLKIFNENTKSLLGDGLVKNYAIDTYVRELERYHPENMIDSEWLFHHDSVFVVKMLNVLQEYEEQEEWRWRLALISIDVLLDDFNIQLKDRIGLMEKAFNKFKSEFVDSTNKKNEKLFNESINKKLRENRKFLEKHIYQKDYSEIVGIVQPLMARSRGLVVSIENIKSNIENNGLDSTAIILSYIHMNLNRIFITKARMNELVIYYLLFKTYHSISCRKS